MVLGRYIKKEINYNNFSAMIRFTLKYLKPIALFLSVMVLFQCCVVYDKQPVSIRKAINKNHDRVKWIKIEMLDGQQLIADSIYYKGNDLYYSKQVKSREKIENSDLYRTGKFTAEVKIDEDKIVSIQFHNKGKSIGFSVLIGISIFIIGFVIIGGAANGFSYTMW